MESRSRRVLKDERDRMIEVSSSSYALEYMVLATQVLTLVCFVKGNPAWKGSLSLLFLGAAAKLFGKYREYGDAPYAVSAAVVLAIGVALMAWFAFAG